MSRRFVPTNVTGSPSESQLSSSTSEGPSSSASEAHSSCPGLEMSSEETTLSTMDGSSTKFNISAVAVTEDESAEESALGAEDAEGEHSEECSTYADSEQARIEEMERIVKILSEHSVRYDWTTLTIRAGITSFLYPSQMAQLLMQVGYEPFPPKRSVTLLGRPCLLLPSAGGYLRYIYQVDGIRGIFRGLVPRLAHQLLFTYVFDHARCKIRTMTLNSIIAKHKAILAQPLSDDDARETNEDSDASDSTSVTAIIYDHIREVIHDLGAKLTAVIVAYPLHVVVVRMVSQFVGREHCLRSGVLAEVRSIYSDFGLAGFYRGLVPKLVGETCQTLAVGALAFFVSNQALAPEVRSVLNLSFSILVSAWTYQFSVVSTTMAVNGSCLKVGNPPFQPIYENWIECWNQLKRLNMLNRGSSIICRYYTGPTLFADGFKIPTGIHFGPNHLQLSKSLLS